MMRSGRIYEQATWVPRTGAKESGLWPTPQTFDAKNYPGTFKQEMITTGIGHAINLNCVEMLMGYPKQWTDCADSETRLSLK